MVAAASGRGEFVHISKLNELALFVSLTLESEESKSANDMNMGLAAIVVNGDFSDCPPEPKPKSIFIALSVAVVCGGLSSKRLSTAGSKVVNDVQSIFSGKAGGLDGDTVAGGKKDGAEFEVGELNRFIDDWPDPEAIGWSLPIVFGTENVNAACLSDTFSSCSRTNKSRRLTFSELACSFLASKAATLSSSFARIYENLRGT